MILSSTFSKSNSPGGYAPWMVTATTYEEYIFREKLLQLTRLFAPIYGVTTNAPANSTIASQFIAFVGTINGAEDTSELGVSRNISFSGEATETHIRNKNGPSELIIGKPTVIIWPTLVEETTIRTYYNIGPKRTINDLVEIYEASLSSLKDQLNKNYIDIDLPIDNDEDEDEDDGGLW